MIGCSLSIALFHPPYFLPGRERLYEGEGSPAVAVPAQAMSLYYEILTCVENAATVHDVLLRPTKCSHAGAVSVLPVIVACVLPARSAPAELDEMMRSVVVTTVIRLSMPATGASNGIVIPDVVTVTWLKP